MDNSDEEKLTLRDKIVLSLLNGYFNNNSDKTDMNIKDALLHPNKDDLNKHTIKGIENRIRAAYKMADLVRKIRLESFS